MYMPTAFEEARLPVLHAAIRDIGFASLVSPGTAGLQVTHLPLLLAADEGPHGTLYGHVARANAHWREAGTPSLAIFLGPDAYVTPSWYPGKREHGREVPTWNYVAVHAHGVLESFDDPAALRGLLGRLTDRHEHARPQPWSIDDAPAEYIDRTLRAIVGLRMPIERIEGKWKLSQNRSADDRRGVLAGLDADDTEISRAMAAAIRADLAHP